LGLDLNPLAKPIPGHEAEFAEVWRRYQLAEGRIKDPAKGFLSRFFSGAKRGDAEALAARIAEISVPHYEAVGAPVVGEDEAADRWLRERFAAGDMPAFRSLEEAVVAMEGYHALEALPDCDGFPVYTNANAYEGVDRASFRGSFLKSCEPVLGEELINRAWEPMLAADLARWGAALGERARAFAARDGVETVIGRREIAFAGEDDPATQAHIADSAARWALWWSARGHGSEPYF
jgi:hypothetical protein